MAITYHSGRRIQGLSTDEAQTATTDENFSSSTGWTKSPSNTSYWNIASDKLSWDCRIASTGQGYNYDLSSDISGVSNLDGYSKWLLRFEIVVTGGTNLNADCITTFGISSNNDFTSGVNGNYSSSRSHIMLQCCVLDPSANTRTLQMRAANDADLTQQQTPNVAFTNNVTYYVEIKKTGSTAYTVSWTSNSDYVTSTNSKDFTITLTGLKYLHMESWLQNSNTSYESRSQGYINNLKFYPAVDTLTPRPTNVQVGSRFEETDTRKMYYYNEPSQDFASVLSTYAPQFFLKLDEGTGTSLTNSGSNSGYTASITVDSSNPVWDTGVGGTNKALKFGNGSTDSYIGHTNLPTENTDNFTMGITFKISTDFTGGDSNHHHLWQWDNSGLGFWQMNMTNDGYIGTGYYNSGWQHLVGTTDSSDNAWHTFFLTCTSGSAVKGYLDGTQEFSGTANRSGYAGNDVDWIGHRGGNGTISYDNVFFKNSVLTASEISSLHDLLVPSTDNVWEELGT
jgi:hypothetical protein